MGILMTKLILGCALLLFLMPPWHQFTSLYRLFTITSSLDIQFLMEPVSLLETQQVSTSRDRPSVGKSNV